MINYTLELIDDRLLNVLSFVSFLKTNEGNNIEITVNQESHCLRYCGVYALVDLFNFKSVTFITHNAVEFHDRYTVVNSGWRLWLQNFRKFNFDYDYSWNGRSIFGCFYRRPTASRLGIVSYIATNYPSTAEIKLLFDDDHEDARINFELQKLYSWDKNSPTDIINLFDNYSQFKSEFSEYDPALQKKYEYSSGLIYLYKNILVDLVIEAHLEGNSFYPTEKFVRAVLCKKPFIVMAPRFYLRYLRQIGFKTFNDFWSEEYDELTPKDRYFAVLKLIDQFSNMTHDELTALNSKLKETVEYNYQLLVGLKFNKNVERFIPTYD